MVEPSSMKQVWACGGGTQSAAIAGLIYEGKLPKPDFSLMVDTEREKSSTWRYVNGVIKPKLAEIGVDLVIVPKSQYATVDLFRNDSLLIPAYTLQTGQLGKMSGFCSNEWKKRVMDRWLRERGIEASKAITWKGFSTNELNRLRAGRDRYPLVFEYPMRREDCRDYVVVKLGWPEPPKGGSACWFCPEMKDEQWVDLRDNDPEDFEKACDMDDAIRQRDPDAYIHRSGRPLREVRDVLGSPGQSELFPEPNGCQSGVCFV